MTRVLADRYEVQGTLGTGGMATVYSGRDRVLDRPVAIKVLADRYAGDEKFVTRFRREARAAAGLNHPNIVSVYDTGDTDGEHYIVMELVEGETLADLLRREGRLSADHVARIASGIAEALRAAHAQGLIHRDVKPGNVMLTRAGEVKVMDFGIARAATDDTLTQTGLILGTASYLSPEQSRGDAVDHRSDIYSLGCVTYEMLAGAPPFTGSSPLSVAYKHVNDEPASPSHVNPSIPSEMETVVMRSLAKDPDARFADAEAFRQAITAAASGEPTEPLGGDTAVLPPITEPLKRVPRRRRSWIPAAVLGIVILLGAVMALALVNDGERQRDGGGRRRAESPTPTVEPSPSPTTLGVEDAAVALNELVDVSLQAGLISEEVALEALEDGQDAMDSYAAEDLDRALEHLNDADVDIESSLASGDLAAPEVAITLHDAIDDLRRAMLTTPPIEESPVEEDGDEDEEDSSPGNSGEAPGHEKKDKD